MLREEGHARSECPQPVPKKSGSSRVAQGVKGVKDGTQLKVTVPFESNWEQARCNTQLLQNDLKPAGITIVQR